MTFAEVSQLVISGLKPDGDVTFDLPEAAPYFSTPFGLRVQLLLAAFTRDTYYLLARRVEVTIEEGDHEFDFADPANCDRSLFSVRRLWIGNTELERLTTASELLDDWTVNTPPGRPSAFAQLDGTKILFNVEADQTYDDCFAQGFYRHPRFTADAETVLLAEEDVLLFDRYAQAFLRQDVAGDEVGLSRLRMIDRQAYEAVNKLRAQRIRNLFTGVSR